MILQIVSDIVQGLRYLHSSSILHGDLTSRNVLINSRFRAKLCDHGDGCSDCHLKHQTCSLSRTKTTSFFWMAPEHLCGQEKYNEACDIYSVGIILYEMYSQKNPYNEDGDANDKIVVRNVLRAVCNRRLNKRPKISARTPPKMVNLMKGCWNPSPKLRPQADELEKVIINLNEQDTEPLRLLEEEETIQPIKAEKSLYELFPKNVADALNVSKNIEPESHAMVTIVFLQIENVQELKKDLDPLQASNLFNRWYMTVNKIAKKHQVFIVKRGDDNDNDSFNVMGVTNLEGNDNKTHVKQVAAFAIDLVQEAATIGIAENKSEHDDENNRGNNFIQIRVGFHSGPITSAVFELSSSSSSSALNEKYRYGLFGNSVLIAKEISDLSSTNRILCSELSYKLLQQQEVKTNTKIFIKKRGKTHVQGKGLMNVYSVAGNGKSTVSFCTIKSDD